MGCDLHGFAEQKGADGSWEFMPDVNPFDWRSYNMYGWLADVRNYAAVPYIAKQRGVPEDASPEVRLEYAEDYDGHSASWVSLAYLLEFDYEAEVENRRASNGLSGAATVPTGEGQMTTYREFLGTAYFNELARLKSLGVERVIFWFDN